MQTCSKCNASSPDDAKNCHHCQAPLVEFSATAVTLKRYRANPRVSLVRISVAHDACPHCYGLLKTWQKDEVPTLPHRGCSHENGCRCTYEPVLNETAIVGKIIK